MEEKYVSDFRPSEDIPESETSFFSVVVVTDLLVSTQISLSAKRMLPADTMTIVATIVVMILFLLA